MKQQFQRLEEAADAVLREPTGPGMTMLLRAAAAMPEAVALDPAATAEQREAARRFAENGYMQLAARVEAGESVAIAPPDETEGESRPQFIGPGGSRMDAAGLAQRLVSGWRDIVRG